MTRRKAGVRAKASQTSAAPEQQAADASARVNERLHRFFTVEAEPTEAELSEFKAAFEEHTAADELEEQARTALATDAKTFTEWRDRGREVSALKAEAAALRSGTNTSKTVQKPLQRRAAQEEAILSKLRELGLDPQALQLPKQGLLSPAKQSVREALKAVGYSDDVFRKAWQRLRNEGRIKDAKH